ncbi:hypothetical protein ANTRET_LOCUS9503 [Anthophora retusa]
MLTKPKRDESRSHLLGLSTVLTSRMLYECCFCTRRNKRKEEERCKDAAENQLDILYKKVLTYVCRKANSSGDISI